MPARRSRTLEWRRCLGDIQRRNGSIEIAIANDSETDDGGAQLIWRVRVLSISDDEVIVEQPMALGKAVELEEGLRLAAVIAIGQNRWMFNTVCRGSRSIKCSNGRCMAALAIKSPDRVERCQRRNYYRINTASITLPRVQMWPLLNPRSVVLAERANELQFEAMVGGEPAGPEGGPFAFPDEEILPEVGPQFEAELLNVGGGGVGLRVAPENGQAIQRHKTFWLRIKLRPNLASPICATAKLAHTHMESSQHYYAGMSFDFSHNPSHQQFVVDQICRYIADRQREQFEQQEQRKTA